MKLARRDGDAALRSEVTGGGVTTMTTLRDRSRASDRAAGLVVPRHVPMSKRKSRAGRAGTGGEREQFAGCCARARLYSL